MECADATYSLIEDTEPSNEGYNVSRSKTRKITSNTQPEREASEDVFYMDLQEVRDALANKYEFLAERYEQKYPKHKGIS